MSSIYQKAMGSEFNNLHPKIRKRFSFSSKDGIASIGRGVMEDIWIGRFYTIPFLYIGTWRNIMFPAKGSNIPFTIENYAYEDVYGRETVTWVRKFYFPNKVRRFDATMIFSTQRNMIVDYLGNHQHLAVDIHISVAEKGGLNLLSGEQRFYEGTFAFRFPMFFSGYADVCEWYDEEDEKYKIEVTVRSKLWGRLFGYKGTFDVEYISVNDVPADLMPKRTEKRE